MSFISELLDWFEVKRPDFVKPIQAIDLTGTTLAECREVVRRSTNHGCKLQCLYPVSFRYLWSIRLYKSSQCKWKEVKERANYYLIRTVKVDERNLLYIHHTTHCKVLWKKKN